MTATTKRSTHYIRDVIAGPLQPTSCGPQRYSSLSECGPRTLQLVTPIAPATVPRCAIDPSRRNAAPFPSPLLALYTTGLICFAASQVHTS